MGHWVGKEYGGRLTPGCLVLLGLHGVSLVCKERVLLGREPRGHRVGNDESSAAAVPIT